MTSHLHYDSLILMVKISIGQRKVSAEILGNIAVGWFIAGVITPVLSGPETKANAISLLITSLIMTVVFASIALILARKIKS